MGLVVISQRPARVDKNVLSQCNTQITLKITNPNDLKAITDSVEGVTPGLKDEIRDLPVGMAVITGATDQPLMVDVRVRRSMHGGESIQILERESIEKEERLLFRPKSSKKDITDEFKGISDIRLLNYPLWRALTKHKGKTLSLYIDGITGEIVFRKDNDIERSRGVRKLMELKPSSRHIVLYLERHKLSTSEKLAEGLRIPLSSIQSNVKELLSEGHISTDGYMFQSSMNLELPPDPEDSEIMEKPVCSEVKGITLDFMVSEEFAKKAAGLWGLDVKKTEPVYYPYWLVKHKGKKLLIDAITKRVDIDLSKAVREIADLQAV